MILLKYKELFIKYIFCSILLIIVMLVLVKVFYKKTTFVSNDNIISSSINYIDDKTIVNVKYPRFNNDKLNKILTDRLYSYIREFKKMDIKKSLEIDYELYYINDFVNVQYHINNSLDNIKYDNVLLNTKKGELAYISSIFDEDYLKYEIYNQVRDKYSSEIYEQVVNDTTNNFTYIMSIDHLTIYFNSISDYPFIELNYNINNHFNDNSLHKHKYIIFTYDDGPSEYTADLLEILNKYNSSATFFMLGNKMKYYDDVILNIYNSKSEIGSHGFSHIDLSNADEETIKSEINSTNAIYNEITKDNIKLYRPAFNQYNNIMDNLKLKIINHDFDVKDWLVKNPTLIYENVIRNACDGCIIQFRDTYKETIDATNKLIPELNKLGYEVVSVSEYNRIMKK